MFCLFFCLFFLSLYCIAWLNNSEKLAVSRYQTTVEINCAIRMLCVVIGFKISRQFFNQWEAKSKSKSITPCTRDFSRTLSKLHVIAWNSHWFIVLLASLMIGLTMQLLCIGFSTVVLVKTVLKAADCWVAWLSYCEWKLALTPAW